MEDLGAEEGLWGVGRVGWRDGEVEFEEAGFVGCGLWACEEYVELSQVGRGVEFWIEEVVWWEGCVVQGAMVGC